MTTETATTQGAETAKTDDATTSTTTTDKEVTLDDVYRGAFPNGDTTERRTEPVQAATDKTEPQKKIEPSSIPDPLDSENFKAWLAQNAAGTQELHKAVGEIARHLTHEQQQRLVAATKADIDGAVKAIEETVQLGKPKVIEAYLDGEVRADPRMKALWENRAKNPAAWNSAVQVVAKKMAKEFDLKTDPALAAAQRARKEGQKTLATTAAEEPDESWNNLSQADFDQKWQQLVSGGQ